MSIELIIGNHQDRVAVPEKWLTLLEAVAGRAVAMVLERAAEADSPLFHLGTVDVALVDDETSARIHRDFMEIEGATDVITFHHGEIVISAEVAWRQAAEFGEPPLRELLRYVVHGLLHLAGHEDGAQEERARMEEAQEAVIAGLWVAEMAAAAVADQT
jgi:probable rRNA maturation factor